MTVLLSWQFLASVLTTSSLWPQAMAQDLPIVDLGYVRQQATEYNDTLSIFSFLNVRYGRPPVGNLRWARPKPPTFEPTLQRGEKERICFQSQPAWQVTVLGPWIEAYTSNQVESFYKQFPNPPGFPPIPANLTEFLSPVLPAETEDCLFLDVHVPKEIFDRRADGTRKKSPIFLWVHGGGLVLGHKGSDSDFKGLLARSREKSKEPVIVVSINYRLGAFGFLGGPSLKASGGVSNAGLLDQRLAFKWVQKYAHLFGGDAQRVTVAGESAGAASIVHHITARGGKGKAPPFQQALIQSAGWNPSIDSSHLERAFKDFLTLLKVKTLQQARKVASIDVRNANYITAYKLQWGELGFGAEPDGEYVPESPAKLLREGKFHRGIGVMVGQNAADGFLFTSPWARDEQRTLAYLSDIAPTLTKAQLSLITSTLYPPTFTSPASPYTTYLERATRIVSELGLDCNGAYVAHAFAGKIYNYLFSVPPAFHGDDIAYTFFDPTNPDPATDAELAGTFQQYLLNFVRKGDPNADDSDCDSLPRFESYGSDDRNWTLDVKSKESGGLKRVGNPGANERCFEWQRNL